MLSKKNATVNRLLLTSGIVGTLCFMLAMIVEGATRPGYNAWTMAGSSLSLIPAALALLKAPNGETPAPGLPVRGRAHAGRWPAGCLTGRRRRRERGSWTLDQIG